MSTTEDQYGESSPKTNDIYKNTTINTTVTNPSKWTQAYKNNCKKAIYDVIGKGLDFYEMARYAGYNYHGCMVSIVENKDLKNDYDDLVTQLDRILKKYCHNNDLEVIYESTSSNIVCPELDIYIDNDNYGLSKYFHDFYVSDYNVMSGYYNTSDSEAGKLAINGVKNEINSINSELEGVAIEGFINHLLIMLENKEKNYGTISDFPYEYCDAIGSPRVTNFTRLNIEQYDILYSKMNTQTEIECAIQELNTYLRQSADTYSKETIEHASAYEDWNPTNIIGNFSSTDGNETFQQKVPEVAIDIKNKLLALSSNVETLRNITPTIEIEIGRKEQYKNNLSTVRDELLAINFDEFNSPTDLLNHLTNTFVYSGITIDEKYGSELGISDEQLNTYNINSEEEQIYNDIINDFINGTFSEEEMAEILLLFPELSYYCDSYFADLNKNNPEKLRNNPKIYDLYALNETMKQISNKEGDLSGKSIDITYNKKTMKYKISINDDVAQRQNNNIDTGDIKNIVFEPTKYEVSIKDYTTGTSAQLEIQKNKLEALKEALTEELENLDFKNASEYTIDEISGIIIDLLAQGLSKSAVKQQLFAMSIEIPIEILETYEQAGQLQNEVKSLGNTINAADDYPKTAIPHTGYIIINMDDESITTGQVANEKTTEFIDNTYALDYAVNRDNAGSVSTSKYKDKTPKEAEQQIINTAHSNGLEDYGDYNNDGKVDLTDDINNVNINPSIWATANSAGNEELISFGNTIYEDKETGMYDVEKIVSDEYNNVFSKVASQIYGVEIE